MAALVLASNDEDSNARNHSSGTRVFCYKVFS